MFAIDGWKLALIWVCTFPVFIGAFLAIYYIAKSKKKG